MDFFKEPLEIIALLGGFGGIVYHIANIESKIYRSIDTTCDAANNRINHLEKQLELHILEYKQQLAFNQEISKHLQKDIHENFKRIHAMFEEYKEICQQISCLRKIKKDENST